MYVVAAGGWEDSIVYYDWCVNTMWFPTLEYILVAGRFGGGRLLVWTREQQWFWWMRPSLMWRFENPMLMWNRVKLPGWIKVKRQTIFTHVIPFWLAVFLLDRSFCRERTRVCCGSTPCLALRGNPTTAGVWCALTALLPVLEVRPCVFVCRPVHVCLLMHACLSRQDVYSWLEIDIRNIKNRKKWRRISNRIKKR